MITTPVEQYVSEFADIRANLPGERLPWLESIRKQAMRSIGKNGFPHRKHEEWKYTDISNIAETFFNPLQGQAPILLWKELNGLGLDFSDSYPMLFLDGRYMPLVADTVKPPEGITIESLQQVLDTDPESVQNYLARLTDTDSNIFTDLSTAFMNDGAFIQLSKNAKMPQPIQLVFISTSQTKPVASQPRNLFILAEGAEATIVQKFISLNHASLIGDPVFIADTLESLVQELKGKEGKSTGPRLMMVASCVAQGDTKVLDLVGELGGRVVVEEVAECVRYYKRNIKTDGDLIDNLAEGYLRDREPWPFVVGVTQERSDRIFETAKEYGAQGIIWYQLKYCECYDFESHYNAGKADENGIPFIKLSSEYEQIDKGTVRTRIEAFLETISN